MQRWDWIEGIKAETPTRVAVRELFKMLTDELSSWPPPVDWSDLAIQRQYSELFSDSRRVVSPSRAAVREALRCLQWEFARETYAAEYYRRNHSLQKACPEVAEQLASEFLYDYLREGCFELMERTENRVGRKDILEGLGELTILLSRAWLSVKV